MVSQSSLRRGDARPLPVDDVGVPTADTGTSPLDRSLAALDSTEVTLVGVAAARDVLPQVGARRYLHSGPPIALDEVPGPMRGALVGALMFEGEAGDPRAAAEILDAGEIELVPCHDAGAVGAMAGIVTPSMPGVVGRAGDRTVFSPLNEGLGAALRFGSFDDATLERLRWLRAVAGPLLGAAIEAGGAIELCSLISEGLRRGDECHNRNVATSAMILARLAPSVALEARTAADAAAVFEYAAGNRHFALPFSIVAAKALTVAAHGVGGSPIVTAMSGNGRRFGIRVSGAGDRWFLAPAPLGEPRLFDGYAREDATPTMGDSMITETAGWGAFAMTAAPAITSFIGGTPELTRSLVEEMRTISAGTSTRFLVPADGFRGTPIGIDVHRVREHGIAPVINNGMAHREAGRGQVGAGITRLPIEPFVEASRFLGRKGAGGSAPSE